MPMHFNRIRLLNGSGATVKKASYAGRQEVEVPPTSNPDFGPRPIVPQGTPLAVQAFQEDAPPQNNNSADTRQIDVLEIKMLDNSPGLTNWSLYFPGTQDNQIESVDLEVTGPAAGPFHAVARVNFYDATWMDFHSPDFM